MPKLQWRIFWLLLYFLRHSAALSVAWFLDLNFPLLVLNFLLLFTNSKLPLRCALFHLAHHRLYNLRNWRNLLLKGPISRTQIVHCRYRQRKGSLEELTPSIVWQYSKAFLCQNRMSGLLCLLCHRKCTNRKETFRTFQFLKSIRQRTVLYNNIIIWYRYFTHILIKFL